MNLQNLLNLLFKFLFSSKNAINNSSNVVNNPVSVNNSNSSVNTVSNVVSNETVKEVFPMITVPYTDTIDSYIEKIWYKTNDVTADEAKTFFENLYKESLRKIKLNDKAICTKPNCYPTNHFSLNWKKKNPIGVTDHNTAGDRLYVTLNWFSSEVWKNADGTESGSNASSEFVIDKDGRIYLIIDFWNDKYSWHEPKVNGKTIAIEHINSGPISESKGKFFTASNKEYTGDLTPVKLTEKFRGYDYYIPYTRNQIISNLIVKKSIYILYKEYMDKEYFKDHSYYRQDKYDNGPLWPLDKLTEIIFSDNTLSSYQGFIDTFKEY